MSFKFNENWSKPHLFRPHCQDRNAVLDWGCQGKKGVYAISNDRGDLLYVGRAGSRYAPDDNRDIAGRLQEHLGGRSHRPEINEMIKQGEPVSVRWVESRNPELTEGIAIIQMEPKYNARCEWKELVKFASDREMFTEANRLGMIQRDPYVAIAQEVVNRIQTDRQVAPWHRDETRIEPERIAPVSPELF